MPVKTKCVSCTKTIHISRKGLCSSCYQKKRYAERRSTSKPNHNCEHCGKAFWSNKKTVRFCSLKCAAIARRGPVEFDIDELNRVTLTCKHCGSEFKVYPYEARKGRRFCSRWCSSERLITTNRGKASLEGHWRQQVGFRAFARAWIREHPECQKCDEADSRKLVMHHPKKPGFDLALLFDPRNIKVLCRPCHARIHS